MGEAEQQQRKINMTAEQILTTGDLSQFIGSEQFFRHALSRKHLYTEGAQFVAERARAYWLLDKIALHGSPEVAREDFQVWKLSVNPDHKATLTTSDGNDGILKSEALTFTDFPLSEITLWAVRNEFDGFTIMLPTEY
jgi:hypothetical protein